MFGRPHQADLVVNTSNFVTSNYFGLPSNKHLYSIEKRKQNRTKSSKLIESIGKGRQLLLFIVLCSLFFGLPRLAPAIPTCPVQYFYKPRVYISEQSTVRAWLRRSYIKYRGVLVSVNHCRNLLLCGLA